MPFISGEAYSNELETKVKVALDYPANDSIALPNKTNTPDSNLIVFANNTVLLDSPPFVLFQLGSKAEYLWTCFSLRLKPSTVQNVNVSITATGLGQAAFAYEDLKSNISNNPAVEDAPEPICKVFRGSSKGWTQNFSHWSQFLELSLDRQESKRIALRIPVDLVPQAGSSVEGKIIIIEPQRKPLEVPIEIQRASDSIIVIGFQWFFSVAFPALLTAGLAFLATQVNSEMTLRREQEEKFNNFKRERKKMLDDFFSGFYSELDRKHTEDDDNFVILLKHELENQEILQHIPLHKSKKLSEALNQNRPEEIKQELSKLFPSQKKIIQNSSKNISND